MRSQGGPLDPDEAFQLLGDPMRTAILREVWAATNEPIAFSTIRERLGNPDSGRFNYHLDRLVGHYLSRDDDGYGLSQAGREVVRAMMAGRTSPPSCSTSPTRSTCSPAAPSPSGARRRRGCSRTTPST